MATRGFILVGFFFSSSTGTLRSMKIKRYGHLCPTHHNFVNPGLLSRPWSNAVPTWCLRKPASERFPRFSSFVFVWLVNRCACGRSRSFWFCSVGSGVTDGSRGGRRPPWEAKCKKWPPSEISWTAEYESAYSFWRSVGLDIVNTEIVLFLANQHSSNES